MSNHLCKDARMICRKKEFKIGDFVTVTHCWGGYLLPIDLPDGAMVNVLQCEAGQAIVRYQDKQFIVTTANVQSGWEYRFKGKWRDESDPLILEEIENRKLKRRNPRLLLVGEV